MAQFVLSPESQHDVFRISTYIAQDKPVAGKNWVDRFEQKCQMLAEMPEAGQRRPEFAEDLRSSTLGNFVLLYQVISGGIEVIRGSMDARSLKL